MKVKIMVGTALARLREIPSASVHCVVCSPPYWGLRSYEGEEGMIGLEKTFDEHLLNLSNVFSEVHRVLRGDGVMWLNYGDAHAGGGRGSNPKGDIQGNNKGSYTGRVVDFGELKPKNLMFMPQRVAMMLQQEGWYVREMLPWLKRNPTPGGAQDRPHSAIEYVFLITKSPKVFYDSVAVRMTASPNTHPRRKDGLYKPAKGTDKLDRRAGSRLNDPGVQPSRNFRNNDLFYQSIGAPHGQICDLDGRPLAIDISVKAYRGAHFATFPPDLIAPLILSGTSEKGCCPQCGAQVERVVRKSGGSLGKSWHNHEDDLGKGNHTSKEANKAYYEDEYRVKTVGWRPTCECNAGDPVPSVVLDPFGGVGTTAMVANQLKRDSILIEISPKYAAMARDRIEAEAGFMAEIEYLEGKPNDRQPRRKTG